MATERVFIGMGGNLGPVASNFERVLEALQRLSNTRIQALSDVYITEPQGVAEQPHFLNAVVEIQCSLSPHALLKALNLMERRCHRIRKSGEYNRPRTLDLDLLLYGERKLSEKALQLPHPRMHLRHFVLKPLMDIDPNLCVPSFSTVAELLLSCQNQSVEQAGRFEKDRQTGRYQCCLSQ